MTRAIPGATTGAAGCQTADSGRLARDWRDMTRDVFDVTAPAPSLFDATPNMTVAPTDGVGTGDLLELLEDGADTHPNHSHEETAS